MDNAQAPIKKIWIKHDLLTGEGDAGGGDGGAGDDGGAGGGGGFQIPDKFLVKAEDGTADVMKSLEKVHGSYAELEKIVGSVGLPPKTAAEYKLDKYLPDGVETKPETMQPILEKFHAAKLSNSQVQAVMSVFGEQIAAGIESNKAAFEAGQAALKESWGDDFDKQVGNANLAKRAYFDDDMIQQMQQQNLDNNPVVLRLLAKIGAELNDDKLPATMNPADMDNIDTLRNSEAYRNPRHPEHKLTVAKVTAAYEKGYKARD